MFFLCSFIMDSPSKLRSVVVEASAAGRRSHKYKKRS